MAEAARRPAPTNTLRVRFPSEKGAAVSVARAFEELSPLGEIARLEVPPGHPSVAVVSYYDVRCAARAAAVLAGRCAPEPWYGEHTVSLDGDVQLMAWMIPEIAAVRCDPDSGTYTVEFFDTRAAERAASEFHGAKFAAVPEDAAAAVRPPAAQAQGPRYRNDLRLSEVNWADLSSGRDSRTTLRLRCLPGKLCDEEAFKWALQRADLSEHVDCFRIFPGQGKRPGSALVNASSDGVVAVAKYFHGRQWGSSMPVSVSFAAVQGAAEVQRAFPSKSLQASARCEAKHAKSAEPWRIEPCDLGASFADEPAGVSEVSTEVGDETESPIYHVHPVEALRAPYPRHH